MKVVETYEKDAVKLRAKAKRLRVQARGATYMAEKLEALARMRRSLGDLRDAAEGWQPRRDA